MFETPDELWAACVEYFQWVERNPLQEEKVFHASGLITRGNVYKMRPMTQVGLLVFLGISAQTWHRWRADPVLGEIVTRADSVMYEQKFSGAAAELLNPNLIARELGLAEKREHTGADGGPIQSIEIQIVRVADED